MWLGWGVVQPIVLRRVWWCPNPNNCSVMLSVVYCELEIPEELPCPCVQLGEKCIQLSCAHGFSNQSIARSRGK